MVQFHTNAYNLILNTHLHVYRVNTIYVSMFATSASSFECSLAARHGNGVEQHAGIILRVHTFAVC